jgi:alkanesulfonate monooxygenase
MPMTFHWRLILGRGAPAAPSLVDPERVAPESCLPDEPSQLAFCRLAERNGIESLLVDINYGRPDPLLLSLVLARSTERLRFLVATRPGLMSPTLFVQQVNTFSALADGRIDLNVVAGHSPAEQLGYGDQLGHDERYDRMDEWLSICRAFWDQRGGPVDFSGRHYRIERGRLNTPFVGSGRTRPRIFVGGSSAQAIDVAARHGDVWVRFVDSPSRIYELAAPIREAGVAVGLRLSVICRARREDAVAASRALVSARNAGSRAASEERFVRGTDAASMRETYALAESEWLEPWLWMGAVRVIGAVAACVVGTPAEVAAGFLAFGAAGVSHFILSGWPSDEEMRRFGEDVLPLIREAETAIRT